MWAWSLLTLNLAPALVVTNMSGSGRARASSFAEPPGAPGSAAAGAGSAVAGGSSTGKTGAPQATGSSSTSFGNLKLPSEYLFGISTTRPGVRVGTGVRVVRYSGRNVPEFVLMSIFVAVLTLAG